MFCLYTEHIFVQMKPSSMCMSKIILNIRNKKIKVILSVFEKAMPRPVSATFCFKYYISVITVNQYQLICFCSNLAKFYVSYCLSFLFQLLQRVGEVGAERIIILIISELIIIID